MNTINKKIDILAFVSCKNSILNGDLDNDGAQRVDYVTGIANASPVSVKRVIRDHVFSRYENDNLGEGYDVLIRKGSKTLKDIEENEEKSLPKGKALDEHFYEKFFDTRAFGFTAASKSLDGCKGPVQFNWAESLDPVEETSDAITNVISYSNSKEKDNKSIGRINRIRYGMFRIEGTINATLAQKTHLSEKDVELVLDGLWNGYEEARSTTRPSIDTVLLIAFEHNSLRGECKPSECYNALTVRRVDENSSGKLAYNDSDYVFELDESKLPEGVRIMDTRHSSNINFNKI